MKDILIRCGSTRWVIDVDHNGTVWFVFNRSAAFAMSEDDAAEIIRKYGRRFPKMRAEPRWSDEELADARRSVAEFVELSREHNDCGREERE